MAVVHLVTDAEAKANPAIKAVFDDIRETRGSDFINNPAVTGDSGRRRIDCCPSDGYQILLIRSASVPSQSLSLLAYSMLSLLFSYYSPTQI